MNLIDGIASYDVYLIYVKYVKIQRYIDFKRCKNTGNGGNMEHSFTYETKIGKITITECDSQLISIDFGESNPKDSNILETPFIKEVQKELEEYFNGTRKTFQLPLALKGTPFQQEVWKALMTIPYGETMTYKQIAEAIGNPKACRAVGMANNRNPIPIIIPCHRVIGSNGALVGYGGGLHIKEMLLEMEDNKHANA